MFTSRFSDCRYFFSYTGCPYSYLLISLGTTKRASCFCCGCHDLPSLMSQLYRNSALMLTGVDDSFAVNVQLHYVWLRASHVAVQCLGATVAPPIISVIQRLIAYLYTHTISHNHMHIHPHTQTHTHTRAQSHTHTHTHAHTHTHTHTRTHTHTHIHTHTRTHTRAHTHTHNHALIPIDIHTWYQE